MSSWHDTLFPRIFAIQAVILHESTVFKFTMQHAAGDAVSMYRTTSTGNIIRLTVILGLYNAAAAFCEGLHGEVLERKTETDREYKVAGHGDTVSRPRLLRSSLRTQQAREWWDLCTGNTLFPALTLVRKWRSNMSHGPQWRTIHVSEQVFNEWRTLASEARVKASDFDLFASWIHLVSLSKVLANIYPSTD
jgi:hypothetical protein